MSILEVPVMYQVEGILNGKRKNSVYNVLSHIPFDVENVSGEDVNLVVTLLNKGLGKVFVTPYYEYNGSIYKPMTHPNFSVSINSVKDDNIQNILQGVMEKCGAENLFDWDCIYTNKGMSIEDYNNFSSDELHYLNMSVGLDKSCENLEGREFKKINSDNLDYMKTVVQNYGNEIINIDGELFRKTYGPYYEKRLAPSINIKSENEIQYHNGQYSFPMSALFFPDQGSGREHSLEYMESEVDSVDFKFPDIRGIVYDYNLLFQISREKFGEFIFKNVFDDVMEKKLRDSHYGKRFPETDVETFFKYLQDKFPSSSEWIEKHQMCIDSDYDFFQVIDTLKSVDKFLKDNKNKIENSIPMEEMQQYIEPPYTGLGKVSIKKTMPGIRHVLQNASIILKSLNENYETIYHYGIEKPSTIIGENYSFHQDNSDILQQRKTFKI